MFLFAAGFTIYSTASFYMNITIHYSFYNLLFLFLCGMCCHVLHTVLCRCNTNIPYIRVIFFILHRNQQSFCMSYIP
ncbi:hypothetical protein FKM82_000024 [Ascaphus truei]